MKSTIRVSFFFQANPPFLKICLSIPFWILCICHFGNLWGLYVQITTVPKFMAEVVGFDLKAAGGLAALPHLVRLFTGMFFGSLEDFLKSRGILGTKAIRKGFILCCKYSENFRIVKCNFTWGVFLLKFQISNSFVQIFAFKMRKCNRIDCSVFNKLFFQLNGLEMMYGYILL